MLGLLVNDCLKAILMGRILKRRSGRERRSRDETDIEMCRQPTRSRVSFCHIVPPSWVGGATNAENRSSENLSGATGPEFTKAELEHINEIEEVQGVEARIDEVEMKVSRHSFDEADDEVDSIMSRPLQQPQMDLREDSILNDTGGSDLGNLTDRKKNLVQSEPNNREGFSTILQIKDMVGDGSFGRVYKAKVLQTRNKKRRIRRRNELPTSSKPIIHLQSDGFESLQDLPLESEVAVKVLSKKRLLWRAEESGETLLLRHIKQEKGVLESLHANTLKSPFLMEYMGAFQTHQKLCLVTEYISGGDLYTLVSRKGPLHVDWVRFYLAELACALVFLHEHQIIFRDIKPENICIAGDGHIKLVDFGLAKGFERGRQKLNYSVVGTVDYMAPEIAAQCGHTQSADWWSFGIFAFDLFYGKPPDRNHPFDPITLPARPLIPAGLEELMICVLIIEPDIRASGHQVQKLPFFADAGITDWSVVESKGLQPPYIPERDGKLKLIKGELLQGKESTPRLKSVKVKEIDLFSQAKFDYFSEYSGYFEHSQADREAAEPNFVDDRLDREHRAHITASQANLQALLDQHQNEDELSPLEEEYGSPLNFTAAAASEF